MKKSIFILVMALGIISATFAQTKNDKQAPGKSTTTAPKKSTVTKTTPSGTTTQVPEKSTTTAPKKSTVTKTTPSGTTAQVSEKSTANHDNAAMQKKHYGKKKEKKPASKTQSK